MVDALIPIRDVNPTRRFPVWTVTLIAANVFVFLATAHGLAIPSPAAYHWGAVPCDVLGRCPVLSAQLRQSFPGRSTFLSIFTSMFMHADVLHIGFNMLFLWVFGNNVEDRLGRIRFPIFYLLTGFLAAWTFIFFAPTTQTPLIGASGAISGVLGAYFVLWPRATVVSIFLFGIIPFRVRTTAWVLLGMWFLVQILGGLAGLGQVDQGSSVAYLAHVGGFVFGAVLIIPFGGRRRQTIFEPF